MIKIQRQTILKAILGVVLLVTTMGVLSVALKTNDLENPLQLNGKTIVGGPFESSNTTSRFALVESLVNQGTFFFDKDLARFGVPDVVEKNGKFFSSFTPGVSFVAAPFYLLGKYFGIETLSTFFATILFAALNGVALYVLGRKIRASATASLIGAAVFLFATNALPYSATLTQHHFSTFIILLAFHNALSKRTILKNILFGLYCGIGFLFDFPNLFMLFPIGIYILSQHLQIQNETKNYTLQFKTIVIFILLGLIPMLGVFGWYNKETSGSPIGFAQFSPRTNFFDTKEKQLKDLEASQHKDPYQPTLPFNTRLQLEGFYILVLSNERSWLWYSPVLLLGIIGLVRLYKVNPRASVLITAIVSTNLILYTMFGDPWGGWSFGPRYLIPSAAFMSLVVGYAVYVFRRNIFFMILFFITVTYSVAISASGALSTTAIPPKQESEALINYIPYTYEYGMSLLQQDRTNSIFYHLFAKNMIDAFTFYGMYTAFLCAIIYALTLKEVVSKRPQ